MRLISLLSLGGWVKKLPSFGKPLIGKYLPWKHRYLSCGFDSIFCFYVRPVFLHVFGQRNESFKIKPIPFLSMEEIIDIEKEPACQPSNSRISIRGSVGPCFTRATIDITNASYFDAPSFLWGFACPCVHPSI